MVNVRHAGSALFIIDVLNNVWKQEINSIEKSQHICTRI